MSMTEKKIKDIVHDELADAKTEWIEEISSKIAEFRDQIVTLLDGVMGELKGIREEIEVMSGRQSEHSDTLEDHEGRITKLEHPLQTS